MKCLPCNRSGLAPIPEQSYFLVILCGPEVAHLGRVCGLVLLLGTQQLVLVRDLIAHILGTFTLSHALPAISSPLRMRLLATLEKQLAARERQKNSHMQRGKSSCAMGRAMFYLVCRQ